MNFDRVIRFILFVKENKIAVPKLIRKQSTIGGRPSYGLTSNYLMNLCKTPNPGDKSTGETVLMKVAKRHVIVLQPGIRRKWVMDKMDVRSNGTVPFTDLITASGSLEERDNVIENSIV